MVREEKLEEVEDRAELNAEERLLDLLLPPSPATASAPGGTTNSTPGPVVIDGTNFTPARKAITVPERSCGSSSAKASWMTARWKSMCMKTQYTFVRDHLRQPGRRGDGYQPQGCPAEPLRPAHGKKRKMKVGEAFEYLVQEEETRLVDMDQVTRLAVERVENSGIIFLDEIDKIAGREGGHGPDV